jgi:hypothetical protein
MDKISAIKATRNGAIAACFSGVFTLGFMLVAMYADQDGAYGYWDNPFLLLDVALIFGCAYGIYKGSRLASIFLFIYFVLSKLTIGIQTETVQAVGIVLVFLYLYGRAVQGAFVLHGICAAENIKPKKSSKWIYFGCILVVIIFFVFLAESLIETVGIVSKEVKNGGDIPPHFGNFSDVSGTKDYDTEADVLRRQEVDLINKSEGFTYVAGVRRPMRLENGIHYHGWLYSDNLDAAIIQYTFSGRMHDSQRELMAQNILNVWGSEVGAGMREEGFQDLAIMLTEGFRTTVYSSRHRRWYDHDEYIKLRF